MMRKDSQQTQKVPLAVVHARFISQLEQDTPPATITTTASIPAEEQPLPPPTHAEWTQWVRDLVSYDLHLEQAVQSGRQIAQRAQQNHLRDLHTLLQLNDTFIMGIVAEPLARLQGAAALPTLLRIQRALERLELDGSHLTGVTREVILAHPKAAYGVLLHLLADPAIPVRRDAIWAMSFLPPASAVAQLLQLLREPHKDIRIAAAHTLKHFPAEIVVDALIRLIQDPEAEVRCAVIDALGHLGDKRALGTLENARRDRDPAVRVFAREACQRLTTSDSDAATNKAESAQPKPQRASQAANAAPTPSRQRFLGGLRSAILSVSGSPT